MKTREVGANAQIFSLLTYICKMKHSADLSTPHSLKPQSTTCLSCVQQAVAMPHIPGQHFLCGRTQRIRALIQYAAGKVCVAPGRHAGLTARFVILWIVLIYSGILSRLLVGQATKAVCENVCTQRGLISYHGNICCTSRVQDALHRGCHGGIFSFPRSASICSSGVRVLGKCQRHLQAASKFCTLCFGGQRFASFSGLGPTGEDGNPQERVFSQFFLHPRISGIASLGFSGSHCCSFCILTLSEPVTVPPPPQKTLEFCKPRNSET